MACKPMLRASARTLTCDAATQSWADKPEQLKSGGAADLVQLQACEAGHCAAEPTGTAPARY